MKRKVSKWTGLTISLKFVKTSATPAIIHWTGTLQIRIEYECSTAKYDFSYNYVVVSQHECDEISQQQLMCKFSKYYNFDRFINLTKHLFLDHFEHRCTLRHYRTFSTCCVGFRNFSPHFSALKWRTETFAMYPHPGETAQVNIFEFWMRKNPKIIFSNFTPEPPSPPTHIPQ